MHYKHSTAGFTLIEMIVSLALFSVVMTIAVGALLVLIASNRQLQDEQAVLTNLSFALDSMTREIRTGTNYYCDSQSGQNAGPSGRKIFSNNSANNSLDPNETEDCHEGNTGDDRFTGIAFVEGGQSVTGAPGTKIVYFYDNNPDGDASTEDGALFRRISGESAQSIVSSNVVITDAEFFVTGSEPLTDGELTQPTVTIYIEAQVADTTNPKTYPIQTTVVQRTLDL
jgi:prepilin-type N-terminal cleavage/methylation domain-containing protein